jgi:HNH endonuclease
MKRPAIPQPLERQVKMEAGHRCAIPACRQTPVELAHIIPWKEVKEHTFENLIALCPTCHTRYDRGEIDRKSVRQYKANLSILNGRYSDLERRVLSYFARQPDLEEIWIHQALEILLMYLLQDGLIVRDQSLKSLLSKAEVPYQITPKGKEFVERWLEAKELE